MNNSSYDTNNQGQLVGKIKGQPQRSYEVEGEWFYELKLVTPRLSQVEDCIPVTISERIVASRGVKLAEGETLAISGEFRSYNKLVGSKSKLMLHFFVHDILSEEEKSHCEAEGNSNSVRLTGFICKSPIYRTTPFNREICDVLLAVNRPNFNSKPFGKSDYIPCIMWGRNARCMKDLPVGTKIDLLGRIQSREYNKTLDGGVVEQRTAYEVSCQTVEVETSQPPVELENAGA